MVKTQILLWKTIEGNSYARLRVRVRVRFLLFDYELTPTDPWCNMHRNFTWTEKYDEAMSDKHPPAKENLVHGFPCDDTLGIKSFLPTGFCESISIRF